MDYEKKHNKDIAMTTEEKAKAYDEALEKARKSLRAAGDVGTNIVTFIFPQLAKSEDERIIRAIIDALYSHTNSINLLSSRGYQMEDIEAWLEKQNVQKTIPMTKGMEKAVDAFWEELKKQKELTKENVIKELEKEFYACSTTPKWFHKTIQDAINIGKAEAFREIQKEYDRIREKEIEDIDYGIAIEEWEKQKEQKPVKKEIALTDFEETLNTFLFDFANSPIEDCEPKEYIKKHSAEILKAAYKKLNTQLQQDLFEAKQEGMREGYEVAKEELKPAEWSEEDEHRRTDAIYFLESAKSHYADTSEVEKTVLWLKSLRPQPKVEWSKEDENYYDTIVRKLQVIGDDSGLTMNQIDFLEKHRPQPHWKPSKEQMEALEECGECKRCVKELYEQLKKLTQEG